MSSPTVALLRKDRPWLLAFLVLGTTLAAIVFGENEVEGVFVVPTSHFAEELELLLVPCAVLFAIAASVGEALRGTRHLLRHRPLAPERIFWVRHLAALGVVAAWNALGMLPAWIPELWSGAGGACVDPSRFGAVAAMSAGLGLDYALVVLGLGLPTSWIARFVWAAALLFLRYAAQSALAFLDPSWPACLIVYALGALLALWIAARSEAHEHDPDRPTPARALVGAAAACVAAAAFFGAIAASGWQELALGGLAKGRALVARLGENEVGLLARPDTDGLWDVVDEHGQPTGRRVPLSGTDHHAAPSPQEPDFDALTLPALHPPFAWYQSPAGAPGTRRVQSLDDALRVVDFLAEDERRCWILPLPVGTTCTRDASLYEIKDGEEEYLYYFAPAVGGLWLVAAETPPRLVPQPLPNGERPLRLDWARDEAGKSQRVLASATQLWRSRAGLWQPHGPLEAPRSRFTLLDDDPLRPEVEFALASGASLRHRYDIAGPRATVCAGAAVLATLLRPPPFALLGAASDYAAASAARPDEALLALDPLLGGGYGWLLWLNLGLTGALMACLVRDLRRRGIGGARLAGWILAVFVAGVFAGPVLLALEPRRAWRKPARTAPPAPLVVAA